ncbi:MAG: hypothetical protein D6714_13770 [Bacteroidetes bacterium]|nr:MAG: hypothetical protein D6714_13770 [Bacteroidota bacterium]
MSKNHEEVKTSNIYELLGLVINKFGFSGFLACLIAIFIYKKSTPEQASEIVSVFISLISLQGTLIQYIVVTLGIFAFVAYLFYFKKRVRLWTESCPI